MYCVSLSKILSITMLYWFPSSVTGEGTAVFMGILSNISIILYGFFWWMNPCMVNSLGNFVIYKLNVEVQFIETFCQRLSFCNGFVSAVPVVICYIHGCYILLYISRCVYIRRCCIGTDISTFYMLKEAKTFQIFQSANFNGLTAPTVILTN